MSICKSMVCGLATVLFAYSANAVSTPVDSLVVSIRVLDEGQNEKVHVNQIVKVSEDGAVNFFSGGELSGSDDTPPLEFGTRISGKLTDSVGQTKSLTLKLEFSNRVDSGEPEVSVVRGEMLALKAHVTLGETTRISVGRNRWCELRIEQP